MNTNMALEIYVGRNNFPKDKKIWYDPEKMIYATKITDDTFNKKVISEIEQGQYLDAGSFIDRFGYKLHMSSVSTGSKILLEVNNTDNAIIADEIGMNAKRLLLTLDNGAVCFLRPSIFPSKIHSINCIVNSRHITDSDTLNDFMEGLIYGDD